MEGEIPRRVGRVVSNSDFESLLQGHTPGTFTSAHAHAYGASMYDGMHISTGMPAPRVDLLEGVERIGIVDADYEPRVRELTPDERTERERQLDERYELMRDLSAHTEPIPSFSEYVERMNNALRQGGGIGVNLDPPTRDGPAVYTPRISRRYHPLGEVDVARMQAESQTIRIHEEMERLRKQLIENLGEND